MITADKSSIRLSVLNRHPTVDFDLDLRFDGFEISSVEVHEMYSDDLSASVSSISSDPTILVRALTGQNSFENPDNVAPKVRKLGKDDLVKGKTTVKKHSWSFFIIDGQKV
jgi:alpha-N-arabinofuranosidase